MLILMFVSIEMFVMYSVFDQFIFNPTLLDSRFNSVNINSNKSLKLCWPLCPWKPHGDRNLQEKTSVYFIFIFFFGRSGGTKNSMRAPWFWKEHHDLENAIFYMFFVFVVPQERGESMYMLISQHWMKRFQLQKL